jgi:hypothetical protein
MGHGTNRTVETCRERAAVYSALVAGLETTADVTGR